MENKIVLHTLAARPVRRVAASILENKIVLYKFSLWQARFARGNLACLFASKAATVEGMFHLHCISGILPHWAIEFPCVVIMASMLTKILMENIYHNIMIIIVVVLSGAMFFLVNHDFFDAGGEIIFEMPRQCQRERETRIRLFGYKADSINLVVIENILKKFIQDNEDINITYEGVKGESYWRALENRVSSGLIDEIFMIDHDHLMEYAREGKLTDLSGIKGLDKFKKWVRQQFTEKDGSVRFLPTCISTYAMWVNLDMLKERGLKVPSTWDEFAKVCDRFVAEGITPIIANRDQAISNIVSSAALFPLYQDEDSEYDIDRFNSGEVELAKELRPGLELVDTMIKRGWINPADVMNTWQTVNDLTAFAEGKQPFMITGGWASPRIKALKPAFAFEAHPLPLRADGGVVPVEVNTCVSANADCPYQDEIFRFVEYMTQPDLLWEYGESQSSFSPVSDSKPPSDKVILPLAEAIANGRITINPDYRLELPLRMSLNETCVEMLNGMNVDEAVSLLESLLKRKAVE